MINFKFFSLFITTTAALNGEIVRPIEASSVKKEKRNGVGSTFNIFEKKKKIKTQRAPY